MGLILTTVALRSEWTKSTQVFFKFLLQELKT